MHKSWGLSKSQAWGRVAWSRGLSLIEGPDKRFQFWKVGCGAIILFTAFAALSLSIMERVLLAITRNKESILLS
jgi:hypothetical protein